MRGKAQTGIAREEALSEDFSDLKWRSAEERKEITEETKSFRSFRESEGGNKMSLQIKNIVENWELLTNGYDYYEEELFTKFQDAFICETRTAPSGIKIIHHARSYVHCADFGKLKSAAGVKNPKSELADLRLLAYSPTRDTARLLFLQFKKGEIDSKGNFTKIGEKQMLLFSEFPTVSFEKKSGPCNILKDGINNVPQSGAMFAIIEYDDTQKKYNLRFMNHTELNPSTAVGATKPKEKHYYKLHTPTISTAPKTSFQYYDYVPSFEEFMKCVKDLEVGREIKISDIAKILPKEEMPDDLKGYFRKEDTLADNNYNNNNYNNNNYNYNSNSNYNNDIEYQVDTVALNVDELV